MSSGGAKGTVAQSFSITSWNRIDASASDIMLRILASRSGSSSSPQWWVPCPDRGPVPGSGGRLEVISSPTATSRQSGDEPAKGSIARRSDFDSDSKSSRYTPVFAAQYVAWLEAAAASAVAPGARGSEHGEEEEEDAERIGGPAAGFGIAAALLGRAEEHCTAVLLRCKSSR